ncbi:hypothetical protein FACS189496_1800 [Bacilli bacterium]|nr:hypothetical protein FACS189496_1800 [Bacilli bacterium]
MTAAAAVAVVAAAAVAVVAAAAVAVAAVAVAEKHHLQNHQHGIVFQARKNLSNIIKILILHI